MDNDYDPFYWPEKWRVYGDAGMVAAEGVG